MDKIKKQDDSVIKTLDIKVIRRLICQTDKGPLELVIRKGENNYFMSLDATPLDKEMNDKLMGILFTIPISQITDTTLPTTLLEPKSLKKKSYYKSKKTLGKTN